MPTFRDSNNMPPILPEGDYVYCVIGFECGLSQGGKTAGSEKYQLELEIEPTGNRVFENLIDHPATAWKIDTFIKSAGVKLAKGAAFTFRETEASDAMPFVNPIGLRGWCRLVQETYEPRNAPGTKRTTNKVATFYTDKEKLPPRAIDDADDDGTPF